MKIIDYARKGNVVRFYLGEKTEDWGWTNKDYVDSDNKTPDWLKPSDIYYGDDWNDRPYECNAGSVYDHFIKGYKDVAFSYDDLVFEPADGEFNSQWSKEDMVNRTIPCIVVLPREVWQKIGRYDWEFTYKLAIGVDGAIKYYFGDEVE